MTICIGALCADLHGKPNQVVVAASDRMVTLSGFMEFEHEIPKAMPLSTKVVGLMAGDAIKGSRMQREVRHKLPSDEVSVQEIANHIVDLYVEHRRREIETSFFQTRGLTLDEFYKGGVMQRILPTIAQFLDQESSSFDFKVSLLVVGVDGSGGHVLHVANPGGSYDDYEQIGYHAIGSGAVHALQALIGFGHTGHRTYGETLYSVYAAKRRAEVAPGVGKDTDMIVINSEGIYNVKPEEIDEIRKVYDECTPPISDGIRAKMATVSLCGGSK